MKAKKIFAAFSIALAMAMTWGCKTLDTTAFISVDKITAGIFLEPAERAVLPPGMEYRGVYDKGLALTAPGAGRFFRGLCCHYQMPLLSMKVISRAGERARRAARACSRSAMSRNSIR